MNTKQNYNEFIKLLTIANLITVVMLGILVSCNNSAENNRADASSDELEESQYNGQEPENSPKMTEMEEEARREVEDMKVKDTEYTMQLESIVIENPKLRSSLTPDPQGKIETISGRYRLNVEGIENPADLDKYIVLVENRYENRRKKREAFNKLQEIPAEPANGYEELYEKIRENTDYPEVALEREIEGTVLVEFTVDEEGQVEEVMVTDGISYEGDREVTMAFNKAAIKAVRATSGDWIPATQGSTPIATSVEIPITFEIIK